MISQSLALLNDAAVTNSKIMGPVMTDGTNLFAVGIDYSNPMTGNNNIQENGPAFLHVFQSTDSGVTWAESDSTNALEVYSPMSTVYGGTIVAGRVDVSTVGTGDLNIVTGVNDTLTVMIKEQFGGTFYPVATDNLVLPAGDYGTSGDATISTALATALNTLAAASAVNGFCTFGSDPTSFDLTCENAAALPNLDHWSIFLSGTFLDGTIHTATPPYNVTGLNWTGSTTDPSFSVFGIGGALPVQISFNTYSAVYHGGMINIVFVGTDQTLTIGQFSTSSNTWQPSISGGPALNMIVWNSMMGANAPAALYSKIVARSTGDLVIMFNCAGGPGVPVSDTNWVVYSGGAWSGTTDTGTQYVCCGAVVDSLDNVTFFLNAGMASETVFIASYSILIGGTTTGPTAVDPSPVPYTAVATGNSVGCSISTTDNICLALPCIQPPTGVPTNVYILEIASSSLITGTVAWTIFRTPVYADGLNQWGGGVDTIYYRGQNYVLCSGENDTPFSYLAVGNGDKMDGTIDTIWSDQDTTALVTPGLGLHKFAYAVHLVNLPNGSLGALYSYLDVTVAAPNYYTRFCSWNLGAMYFNCDCCGGIA
jgi:hypothetical protein